MGFLNGKSSASGVSNGTNGAQLSPSDEASLDQIRPDDGGHAEEELEKVRELLFGVQISRIRQDMDRVENRISDQSGEMRELVNRRLDSFERSLQTRLDKMEQRLGQESSQRLEAYGQLTAKVDSQRETVEAGLEELRQSVNDGNVELTKQLHGQGKLFSESIRRHCQELSAHFEREAEAAAKARADRSAVAKILLELGNQLERGDSDDE
jgi:predicted DNA-binding protein